MADHEAFVRFLKAQFVRWVIGDLAEGEEAQLDAGDHQESGYRWKEDASLELPVSVQAVLAIWHVLMLADMEEPDAKEMLLRMFDCDDYHDFFDTDMPWRSNGRG